MPSGLLVLLVLGLGSRAPVDLSSVQDPLAQSCLAKVGDPLAKSAGVLTPELRKAYVQWAWQSVLDSLKAQNQKVSPDCVAEVEADPTLMDALSAAVYPPDPSILQNYAALRDQMGTAFTQKYRHLTIAMAVARRVKNVILGSNREVGRENQIPIWAYRPLFPPANLEEDQAIGHIAGFLRTSGKSALDVFENPDLQRQLAAYLKTKPVGDRFVQEISRSLVFGERLKNAMILLGQRPGARSPKPDCIRWLKHLQNVFESRPASTPVPFPLFDLQNAPWPLLMPLSHPAPLDEAQYLWESFKGEHGPDRFHTYGPYRDDLTAMPDMLRPSPWYWNAVPDQIVHGGQCMPISLATIDLYTSLGKPAMGAAQPGHANLISFENENGAWRAVVEQDFAGGPRVTFSQWFFDDPHRGELRFRDLFGWPGAEYHLGLAAGMNLGLSSYMDSRIAARIFDLLPPSPRATLGRNLLVDAALKNPFNPEIWYRLAGLAPDVANAIALTRAVEAHDPEKLLDGRPSLPLKAFLSGGKAAPALPSIGSYWQVLHEFVSRFSVLGKPAPPDEATLREAYLCLAGTPGVDAGELLRYTQRNVGFRSEAWTKEQVALNVGWAEKGDRFGCLRMGQRYLDGDGVQRDEGRARSFLSRAARLGDTPAAILMDGMGVPVPMEGVELVPSSTYSPTQDVRHLIDGSGLSGGMHDNSIPAATMWQTASHPAPTVPAEGLPASPAWVRFNFPQRRAFDAVEIWNHNQANLTDRGFRKFRIYGSPDGSRWILLTKDAELPRAAGNAPEPSTSVDTNSSGQLFKSVIIAAEAQEGNYGSADYGLSEVRFVCRPVAFAIPSYQIQVRASSQFSETQTPAHLIDGSGMIGEFHDNHSGAATMWHTVENPRPSSPDPGLPNSAGWVRFNFTAPQYVDQIRIWNMNQAGLTNRGFRKMRMYGTSDGMEWFALTATPDIVLPKATGQPVTASIDFFNAHPERPLRCVVIWADPQEGNHGGNCYGLSAVRFIRFSTPAPSLH